MIVPNDARISLYGIKVICEGFDLSYTDHIWKLREAEKPRHAIASKGWPVARAETATVTKLKARAKG